MLDTVEFFAPCERFDEGVCLHLHHVPEIEVQVGGSVARTAGILAASGRDVDRPLGAADSSNCTPCRPGENGHRTLPGNHACHAVECRSAGPNLDDGQRASMCP
ncbi:hypothetical protein [Streptomyces sp. NPDC002426]